MQRDTIIEKLNRALSEPITTEAQVVYILVLVRKLLGPTTKTDKYERLRFSCDWTVHTELNGPAARRTVKLFDDQVIARGAPLPTGASAIQEYFGKICGPFDILSGFKEKFEEFLDQHSIDYHLLQTEQNWAGFLRLYSSIIEDCPLRCEDNSGSHVKTVLVRKVPVEAHSSDDHVYLSLQWVWVHDEMETVLQDSSYVYPPASS